jgi:aminopeptidase N
MMKRLLATLLGLALCAELAPNIAQGQQQILPTKRGYQVLSYKLLLDWRPVFQNKNQLFSGVNEITVTTMQSDVVFDAMEMRIDSIKVSGVAVTPVPQPIGDTLVVPLGPPMPVTTPIPIQIYYTHTTAIDSGIYFYPKGWYYYSWGDSTFVEEDLAYTMSESSDARKWMPCNDEPYYKANSAISVIVPRMYSAQSNGTLQSVDTNVDGSLQFNWVSDRPIATYLMCASASVFTQWQGSYARLSNLLDTVPVVYFAWPVDYAGTGLYQAQSAYHNTPLMLAAFSKLFGEYPFKQYGQVTLSPFGYGGMEHQTMTSMERPILDGRNEDVIAHELFHQWFGDKTTCETWADIWLNEGFATFGEALWEENVRGLEGYDGVINAKAKEFLHPSNPYYVDTIPIYNPPLVEMFRKNYLTVYNKPGVMLHMLRRVLANDTLFFNTLRDYSSAFAYTTANTFQFMDFFVARAGALSPIDLRTFFNEWLFRPDWPVYQVGWAQSNGKLFVRVTQSQDSSHLYTMPLHFKAISGQDTTVLTFVNDRQSQLFTAQVSTPIEKLMFDTEAVVLAQATVTPDPTLGVQTGLTSEGFLRAQVDASLLKLSFAPVVGEGAGLQILDVLGRIIARRDVPLGETTLSLPVQELASGAYFVRLRDGAGEHTTRFQVEK